MDGATSWHDVAFRRPGEFGSALTRASCLATNMGASRSTHTSTMEVEYEQPPEHAEQRHEDESHHSDGEGAEGVEPATGGEGEGMS